MKTSDLIFFSFKVSAFNMLNLVLQNYFVRIVQTNCNF